MKDSSHPKPCSKSLYHQKKSLLGPFPNSTHTSLELSRAPTIFTWNTNWISLCLASSGLCWAAWVDTVLPAAPASNYFSCLLGKHLHLSVPALASSAKATAENITKNAALSKEQMGCLISSNHPRAQRSRPNTISLSHHSKDKSFMKCLLCKV